MSPAGLSHDIPHQLGNESLVMLCAADNRASGKTSIPKSAW
jgi:hypothetical protein